MLLEILAPVAQFDAFGTPHIAIHAGHAQAALFVFALRSAFFQYLGIDDGAFETFKVWIYILHHVAVNYYHTQAYTYLGSCKPAALGTLECIFKVDDKRRQLFLLGQIGLGSLLAKHFRTVEVNRLDHCFLSKYACNIMAALILSTDILLRLSLFFIPPSIIALCASTEVKRSSSSATGTSGKAFAN